MEFQDLTDGTNFCLRGTNGVRFCKIPKITVRIGGGLFTINCFRLDDDPKKKFLEATLVSEFEVVELL